MNAEKANYWFALLANLGVVAGVVFLALEIQQNNELLVQDSRYSMLENQKDWKFFLNGDPEIAKLIYAPKVEELSDVEKLRRFDILSGLLLKLQCLKGSYQVFRDYASPDFADDVQLVQEAYSYRVMNLSLHLQN